MILQRAERLICRKRRREDGSDWGHPMRLGDGEGGLTGIAAQVELRDQYVPRRESGELREQVSVGKRPCSPAGSHCRLKQEGEGSIPV